MLMMLPFLGPEWLPKQKNACFAAFSEGFSKAKRVFRMFLGLPHQPADAADAGARARARRARARARAGAREKERERETEEDQQQQKQKQK